MPGKTLRLLLLFLSTIFWLASCQGKSSTPVEMPTAYPTMQAGTLSPEQATATIPTPSPTVRIPPPLPGKGDVGNPRLLLWGAGILVLIVIGGVLWQSRPHH